MIYPTRRAIFLAAAGAPVALAVGVAAPGLWTVGIAWIGLVLALSLADAALAAPRRSASVHVRAPTDLGVGGEPEPLQVAVAFTGRAPGSLEVAPEVNDRLKLSPERVRTAMHKGEASAGFSLIPIRRGEGRLERLWVRWRGPLGLVFKQKAEPLDTVVPVTPDIRGIQQTAMRLFARDALFGAKTQIEIGEGAEYNALKEYMPGMDLRTVDWKQSARHGTLLVKEFRTERNHPVVLALDTGRLMCEPLAGAPKIDWALNAALLLAYVSLKIGDRVGLFAFDARPRLSSGAVTGARAFPMLQRLSARIDYSIEETNFTLGLTTLQTELERRSLIVVFTDVADPTSAELMLENVGRLLQRHFVLFLIFQDEELEALARAEPKAAEDVSRAVVAGSFLREREVVIGRLRRMGADIVEAPAERAGPALLDRYLELKRGGRL